MRFIFWLSILWVFYSYLGYMGLLFLLTLFKKSEHLKKEIGLPNITMIIAAFNEEKSIENKIKNCLGLDYPKEKLEIIIASDASTDRTEEIVSRYISAGITFLKMPERKGKTATQNFAVPKACGDILVFSDATTIYKPDALLKLARNFSDESVGIAAGEEEFVKDPNRLYKEAGFSWKYEKILRRLEDKFNSLIGVSGCIFAIRKNLYEKLDDNLIEDFALPLMVLEKGYKVVLEKEAIAYEDAVSYPKDEFARKARIVSGGINALFYMRRLLNPLKNPKLSFQIISHKIMRWFAPVFFISLFISNIFLLKEGIFFGAFFILQTALYGLAFAGFKIPLHFLLLNAAALAGIFKSLKKDNKPIWEPVR